MKSHQSILLLILFSASFILILHSGKTNMQPTLKNRLHRHLVLYKERPTALPGDQQKQDLLRSNTAVMRITRGLDPDQIKEKGSFLSNEQITDREPLKKGIFQDPPHSRILHFPLQPMDLIISPAEAALHSASIAVK